MPLYIKQSLYTIWIHHWLLAVRRVIFSTYSRATHSYGWEGWKMFQKVFHQLRRSVTYRGNQSCALIQSTTGHYPVISSLEWQFNQQHSSKMIMTQQEKYRHGLKVGYDKIEQPQSSRHWFFKLVFHSHKPLVLYF